MTQLFFLLLLAGLGCTTDSGDTDASSDTDETDAVADADCSGIVGEGYAVGQVSSDWTLMDHNGAPVNLYDYCGKVIYIESGAEW